MSVKEEKICRICLSHIYKGFEVLDETARHMFDVLLVKMNWDIGTDPIMCQECAEITRKCFIFKTACVNAENTILSFAYCKKEDKNVETICENIDICRFCKGRFETNSFIPLNLLPNELSMLSTFLPEMDINMTENPLICTPCRENLECYYKFAQNCADLEEKICKYCQNEGICNMNLININDLVPSLIKDLSEYRNNGHFIPVIKKETDPFEDLMKTEEPLNIKDEDQTSDQSESYPHTEELSEAVCTCHSKHNHDACVCRTIMQDSDNSTVVGHLLTHKSVPKPIMHKCSFCTYESKYRRDFSRHLLTHEDASAPKLYKCSVCAHETNHKSALASHLLIHKDASETEIYKCPRCAYKTKNKRYLTSHLLVHKDASETKTYKCSVCMYETKWKSALNSHSQTHSDAPGTKMYNCSVCSYKTNHKAHLARHQVVHKDASETKMYKCFLCSYETNYKNVLTSHMLIHKDASETNMYKCTTCNYETKHKRYLTRHLLIHKDVSETKMYKCSICTYETKHKRYLTNHQLTHKDSSEVQMYKCPFCAHQTKHKFSLSRHVLTHKDAEGTKYKCSVCNHKTKDKRSLTRHQLVHKDGNDVQ